MLFKAKIRFNGKEHEVIHQGHLLYPTILMMEREAKCSLYHPRIVGKKIVAEVELGYEVEAEIVSNRKLPVRKH